MTPPLAVSLAEIEAMGRKAARGAGHAWGMAEEAGRAARWLSAHGGEGPEALAALLAETDGAVACHAPGAERWEAEAGALCAVQLGAALSDIAHEIADGRRIETGPVLQPALALGALALAARDIGVAIGVEADGARARLTPQGPVMDPASWPWRAGALTVWPGGKAAWPDRQRLSPSAASRPVDRAVWESLGRLAARTHVPATESSRERGAGAGVRDGD
jgi:hypothetical protein